MIYQLDVGNTGVKWRLMDLGCVSQRGEFARATGNEGLDTLPALEGVTDIWISSVADSGFEQSLLQALARCSNCEPWFARTPAQTGALKNSYEEPARMGVDRWLVMLAGYTMARGPVCVVDAGSALTIDIIAATGQHEGGYIIPGAQLTERALLADTDRVRFAEDVGYALTPGRSTAEAVRHGVVLTQAGAVSLALSRAAPDTVAVYTGGGGELLRETVGHGGEYRSDLVFEGLELMALAR